MNQHIIQWHQILPRTLMHGVTWKHKLNIINISTKRMYHVERIFGEEKQTPIEASSLECRGNFELKGE